MKVLVMYVNEFQYSTAAVSVEGVEFVEESNKVSDAILAFVQIEETDQEKTVASRAKKLANHIKWTMRKNNTTRVVLHSFAHLSSSKASSDFSFELFQLADARLQNVGYQVWQTPFAHFLDLKIDAPGHSLARIWADL